MNRGLWLLCCGVLLLAGCAKNGSQEAANPSYYVRFKADGVSYSYTAQALAALSYVTDDKLYSGVLQGYGDLAQASKSHIGIFLFSSSALAAQITYQDPAKAVNASGASVPAVMINYLDAQGQSYISAGLLVDASGQFPYLPNPQMKADASVTLTELTSTYVKGRFSATVYLSTDATFATQVRLTEGEFFLQRVQ